MGNKGAIPDETEQEIDIFEMLHNLARGIIKFGWVIAILAGMTSCAACLIMQYRYEPVYTATANFAIKLNLASDGTIEEDNLRASQMSATFPYIITSGVLKNIIAAELGVEQVNESITAENVIGTNLFTIKVKSGEAKRAYDVLHSVISNYPKVAETVVGSTYLNMIDESGVPKEPSNQLSFVRIGELGLLPGAAVGIILILLYALTRRTVCRSEDFMKLSGIRHLGTLPKVMMKKRVINSGPDITILNENLTGYRDNIYRLRIRIEKIAAVKQIKSILITSAIPSEGKSTVALNLALALAEEGKRVILVDFDLCRPSIKGMLPLEAEYLGLEKVLDNELKLEDAIRYIESMKIAVLACSEPVEHSAEIIGTGKIQLLFTKLKEKYDYVIVDTAPSAILSDTSDLAKYVDGAVYVIRQDFAKVYHILEGLDHLSESSSTDILGFVFNCAKTGFSSYGYGYGYGYGKNGYYGYRKKEHGDELITED